MLGIESLLVKMSEISEKLNDISNYYKSIDSDEYLRFEAAKNSLNSMTEKIKDAKDSLKEKIENKQVTITDVREMFYEIEYTVKVGLEDVLWRLLSIESVSEKTGEGGNEIVKNCGSDSNCFEDSFKVCELVIFKQKEENDEGSFSAEIKGIDEDGNCVLEASISTQAVLPTLEGIEGLEGIEPPYTMTCKTPKYSLGISSDPVENLLSYCEGSLAKIMKYSAEQSTISSNAISSNVVTASVIALLDKNHGPGECAGEIECIRFCNNNLITCLGFVDSELKATPGPGGTRSISGMVTYCNNNEESCEEWFLSRGVELDQIGNRIENARFTITGKAIRR